MPSHFLKRSSSSSKRKPKPKTAHVSTSRERIPSENDHMSSNGGTRRTKDNTKASKSSVLNNTTTTTTIIIDTDQQPYEQSSHMEDNHSDGKVRATDHVIAPPTENHCTEINQVPNIYPSQGELYTVYCELLERYKSLLALKEGPLGSLFNEYKEAVEKRFKGSITDDLLISSFGIADRKIAKRNSMPRLQSTFRRAISRA